MKVQELTVLLCFIWAATLLYGEMLAFWVPTLCSCSWPHPSNTHNNSNSTMSGGGYPPDYVKVAVLTDPQLMDRISLPLPPKSLALEIAQFYSDLFMRRSFFASILPFQPDVILFLGDYFDGGPYLSDEGWQESLSRFKHIFGLNRGGKDKDIKLYYLSGNHDIGYASLHSRKPEVIKRYENEFGTRNYRFTVGKVDFIAVDAQTLDGHPHRNEASATWNFVKNVSMDVQLHPRVLLTHIPLHRRDWTPCGPNRKSPIINQVSFPLLLAILQYQNYITKESSDRILDLIKPVLILSGHDHDQCTVTHESRFGPVKEHTLGTISWQQGNLYPSFMLLSASNSAIPKTSSPEAVFPQLCFLPMQTHIYLWYLMLFVLNLFALIIWPTSGTSILHQCGVLLGYIKHLISHFFRSGRKEKDEDENCEYEMIWDAEGTMHLVKKIVNSPNTLSRDRGLIERGSAVMRSTAKKTISQEIEVCMNLDAGFDTMRKILPRTNKSKTKIIVRRFIRTLRMLSVIAAVNIPLYMMLLFKDWIDK
ncbi:LOW QUALITY PROTEIN: Metallophos domain-containing protein [Cephalotus follicularis]|uniref:Metallophos domain-containing protein n=1 Tax=Cephalotus follicularis TaxID=3775 RepID=A0A1Q3CVR3_CEPFO|nr:LOW QUALITY PROTEIN: Metallophos domain-containing protein [Cephalotus follicularis]GAV91172.1 LOW QUALITY PROTEIN: Metallophos domain-containing protein [Cephalotus follicularis]